MIYCEWDNVIVAKTEEGFWICKSPAMAGPTGYMMDKRIPEPWASKIEKDYQFRVNNPEVMYSKIKIIKEVVFYSHKPTQNAEEQKSSSMIKKLKSKGKKKKRISKFKGFNPFER